MSVGEQRWVLAVDVRPGAAAPRTATADGDGVRPLPSPGIEDVLRAETAARGRVPPLAVVVVHPATWDGDRAGRAADEVGGVVRRVIGEDAVEWPWPVPLSALEASAWRALEFGLLPGRARVAVVDPVSGEAGVLDREYGRLAGVGRPRALGGPGGDEQLVALARRVLDEAPAGPPFAGVLIGGADGSGGAVLGAVVARVTGRSPLVPGDPATVALLGAASLGWAAATATAGEAPAPRPRPAAAGQGDDRTDGSGAGARRGIPADSPPSVRVPGGPGGPAALPGGRGRSPLPRWARWVLPLAVLAVVAGAAGLLVHRQRVAPSPFTYTCPSGQVVAFSYECDKLAPQPSSVP